MPLVRFTQPDEFCEELKKDSAHGALHRPIVRCTNRHQPSRMTSSITLLSVIASYTVRNAQGKTLDVIKLEHYCGDLWHIREDQDKKVWDRVEEVHNKIKQTAQDLGLEVRAGEIE